MNAIASVAVTLVLAFGLAFVITRPAPDTAVPATLQSEVAPTPEPTATPASLPQATVSPSPAASPDEAQENEDNTGRGSDY